MFLTASCWSGTKKIRRGKCCWRRAALIVSAAAATTTAAAITPMRASTKCHIDTKFNEAFQVGCSCLFLVTGIRPDVNGNSTIACYLPYPNFSGFCHISTPTRFIPKPRSLSFISW
jgi:hypothetical protein